MSPRTGAVSLRTNNRNFEGRSGTKSAQVYLVSPETAAVSALTGTFTGAMNNKALPKSALKPVAAPEKFPIDDAMFLYRATAGKGVAKTEIVRGPNIATVPKGVPLAKDLKGAVAIKVGDKITTDHIMPAGARLKFRSNIPEYAKFVFEAMSNCVAKTSQTSQSFFSACQSNQSKGIANVIVAGESYGQGSSREHAALCPMYLGVKAVVAKSIERIHRANLVNFGIVPFSFVDAKDYDRIAAGDAVEIRGIAAAVAGDGVAELKTKTATVKVVTQLSDRERHIILKGGLLASL